MCQGLNNSSDYLILAETSLRSALFSLQYSGGNLRCAELRQPSSRVPFERCQPGILVHVGLAEHHVAYFDFHLQ